MTNSCWISNGEEVPHVLIFLMQWVVPQGGNHFLPFRLPLNHSQQQQASALLTICPRCWKISHGSDSTSCPGMRSGKKGPADTGLITVLTEAFCSCHYLGFAPVLYSVSFLDRLSRAAKGILLCQMFSLFLSLYPGKHLSFWKQCCHACSHAKFSPRDV